MKPRIARAVVIAALAAAAFAAWAEPAQAAPALDGAAMGWPLALPFVGSLLSIAAGPLLFPKIWHSHYGKIAALWALLALVHAALAEYMSFIILLFALYVVAGGIHISGTLRGTPLLNAGILVLGTAMASLVGTTGAAMILVRPLIRANATRAHNAHAVIFFIILVANIGGALSPLGDPPLFVGFLHGVDFFWTTQHLAFATALVAALVLAIFLALDFWFARNESKSAPAAAEPLRIAGLVNLPLIAGIIGAILLSAAWKPGIDVTIYGTPVALQNILRDGALIVIALANARRASRRQ